MMQIQSIPVDPRTPAPGPAHQPRNLAPPVACEVASIYERLTRAVRSLRAESAAALFATDAIVVMDDSEDLRGCDAIRGWFEGHFARAAAGGIDLGVSFHVRERGLQNGVVFDVGTFFLTARNRGDVSRVPMKMSRFLAVFRRGVDGRHRIVRLSTVLPPG